MAPWEDWFDRAKFYIREARRYASEGPYWAACLNSHQAAEFALKGLLVYLSKSFPFTHDLVTLLDEVRAKAGINIPSDIYDCADYLSPHYIGARYPGTRAISYNSKRANKCVECSRKILEFVKNVSGYIFE